MVQTRGNLHCVGSRQAYNSRCVRVCVRAWSAICNKLHSTAVGRLVNYLTNYCFSYLSCISHIPTGNIQIYDADRRWSLFLFCISFHITFAYTMRKALVGTRTMYVYYVAAIWAHSLIAQNELKCSNIQCKLYRISYVRCFVAYFRARAVHLE